MSIFYRKRNKKTLLAGTLIFLLILVPVFYFVILKEAQGAIYTWDGGGITNDWSDCDNWSTNICPTASDTARFDNTSDKDATVDVAFAGTVDGVDINSGYDGTITQAKDLIVEGAHFDQAAGAWDTDGFALTVNSNGNFTLSAGTMDATGSTISVERNFTHSGGTLTTTGGTIVLTSDNFSDNTVFTCSGTIAATVDIQKNSESSSSAPDFTLSSGCEITLNPAIDTKGSITNNGTMNGTNINTEEDFTQGASAVTNLSGILTFDDDLYLDDSVLTCSGTFDPVVGILKDATTSGLSPSFTLSSGCTITLEASVTVKGNFINNGTINGTDIYVEKNFTEGASGATNLSGTLFLSSDSFVDSGTVTCTGVLSPTVDLQKDSESSGITPEITIASGCEVTLVANEQMNGSIINHGTLNITDLDIERDLESNGTLNVSGTITFSSDTYQDTSALTCNQTLNNIIIAKDESFSSIGAGFTLSEDCNITLSSDGLIEGDLENNGTITGTNMTVFRNFTNAGTLNLSGILTFGGGSIFDNTTVICTSPFSAPNIEINKTNSNTLTFGSNCTFPGNFTRTNGGVSNPGSSRILTIQGDFSMSTSDTFGGSNLIIEFGGANNQTITRNAGTISSPISINKTSGHVTQNSSLTLPSLTIIDGEYRNSSHSLSITNVLTVNDLLTQGSGNITFGTLTIGSNGTYANQSTGDLIVGAGGVTNLGQINLGVEGSCPTADTISITSSSGGAQRTWSGSGAFNIYDVSVQDQGGDAPLDAFSSTSVSGNGANWTFWEGCAALVPVELGDGAVLLNNVQLF